MVILKFTNNELHHVFSMFYQEQFKNKIKNIEAQIGEILRTPSLDRNLLVLIKKEHTPELCETFEMIPLSLMTQQIQTKIHVFR